MQIDAEIRWLTESGLQVYALMLPDIRGDPIEVTGCRLKALQADGQAVSCPATLGLVFEESRTG